MAPSSSRPQARKLGPYGTWRSPITAETVGGHSLRLGRVASQPPWIYWSEMRPAEGGRSAIMRIRTSGRPEEILGAPCSARSRIHEYGGGEFLATPERVYFVNEADQQIHSFEPGRRPSRLTNAPGMRFADFALDPHRNRLYAIAERHVQGARFPDHLIVSVCLERPTRGEVGVLVAGRDFFAAPRLSPDGACLAYLAWDLPAMPWDEAALHVAELSPEGVPGPATRVAGGDGSAAAEPLWLAADRLAFLWDRTGFANLYTWSRGAPPRPVAPLDAEFGRPAWSLGNRSYAPAPGDLIAAVNHVAGEARLALLDPHSGAATPINTTLRSIDQLAVLGDLCVAIATRDGAPPALVTITREGAVKVLRSTSPVSLAKATVARGRTVEFRAADDVTVYGQFYAPTNALWQAPKGTLPPAIVLAHGGPAGAADRGLKLRIQFWTSRGFAVLDVDYSGSTGYGRAYRTRLDGRWGVRDVADIIAAGDFLERDGLADGARIVVSGGSAGGYSVLMVVASSNRFAAGSCYYGISDLELLLAKTHKFESGYLHRLLGTTPLRWRETFAARSPINLVDRIETPLILFQGRDDKVVPPDQSRMIVERLTRSGQQVEYWEFDGEGHGFRRASTIATALERELAFLTRVLGLA